MIKFTKYRKIYFVFSGILILASLVFLLVFGLKPCIDFTGGSILEAEYKERPSNKEIKESLAGLELGDLYVQPTGEKGVILRMKDITEKTHQEILSRLSEGRELKEERFELIGPVMGEELKEKTKIVVFLSLLAMIVYIALAFRKIQRPLKSWRYGVVSVLTLSHDILIPLAVFSLLGKYYNIEVTIPVITALLAVLGYSINNSVVVFDRIRENLFRRGETFEETVDISLNQTLSRQINTSLTTLFVALAILFFGGATLKFFALALVLGILAGTYSSVFLAAPILVSWLRWRQRS